MARQRHNLKKTKIVELALHRGEGATKPGYVRSCIDEAADRNPPYHRFCNAYSSYSTSVAQPYGKADSDPTHPSKSPQRGRKSLGTSARACNDGNATNNRAA